MDVPPMKLEERKNHDFLFPSSSYAMEGIRRATLSAALGVKTQEAVHTNCKPAQSSFGATQSERVITYSPAAFAGVLA
jgi:hypothetical protein